MATSTLIDRPDPATLKIVHYPARVLKKRAAEITVFDDWLRSIGERMTALMVEHKGVGLAGPQVNLPLRIFVMSPTGAATDALVLINPVLRDESGQIEGEEGCLSLPEIRAKIVRYQKLIMSAVDVAGNPIALELHDYPARIVQHETDHLDGVLIIDRMSPIARFSNRRLIKDLEDAAHSGKKK